MKAFEIEKFDKTISQYIEANAGTGKTYTIVQIVKKMVNEGVSLKEILIVTYTEKAAEELKHRLMEENLPDVDCAPVYTIHSFCQETLDEFSYLAGVPSSLTLIDESECNSFISKYIRDELVSKYSDNPLVLELLADDSLCKTLFDAVDKYYLNSEGLEEQAMVSFPKGGSEVEILLQNWVKEIYLNWQKTKSNAKVQTFNDLIRNVREAVIKPENPLLKALQKKYKYAIIDEFQDTNQKQWDIFSSIFLKQKDHSIFVVGDPKQSIYAFQGADVNVYSKAITEIGNGSCLDTNYRSSEAMVNACNNLFKEGFFDAEKISYINSKPAPKDKVIRDCLYNENYIYPIQLVGSKKERTKDSSEFAKAVAHLIVDYCSYSKKDSPKTRLQIETSSKNEKQGLRNVTFGDFAVLGNKHSDLDPIETELKKLGIPVSRYKDTTLFTGKECSDWRYLLQAIMAPDFAGSNKNILNNVLMTAFFGKSVDEVTNSKINTDLVSEERNLILSWKFIAQKRLWPRLVESIFKNSKIESNLSGLENLQSLSKFREIGDYVCEYLGMNSGSLRSLVHHLERLSVSKDSVEDENGNLVSKSTDSDCVQLMTIHASKGLDFPIVILPSVEPFKDRTGRSEDNVFLFHQDNRPMLFVSPKGEQGPDIEAARKLENNGLREEDSRKMYVALTRASSLMILPWFESTSMKDYLEKGFNEIATSFQESCTATISKKTPKELKDEVAEIIKNTRETETEEKAEKAEENQKKSAAQLAKEIPYKCTYKHSYSSLSQKKEFEQDKCADEDAVSNASDGGNSYERLSEYDKEGIQVSCRYNNKYKMEEIPKDFPKGTEVGDALHEVMEKVDFTKFRDNSYPGDSFDYLLDYTFKSHGFSFAPYDSNGWKCYVKKIVSNTLNCQLPEIIGGSCNNSYFSLNSIDLNSRASEAEYNLNLYKNTLRNYVNGFIDLLFVHNVDGKDVYSIVDWKSDTLSDNYGDAKTLNSTVAEKYSIQRVLYSYTLVKWLKTFKQKTEEDIFNQHFGGIYYIFLRGTSKDCSNGVYAHTWKNWNDLEQAFDKICTDLIKGRQK